MPLVDDSIIKHVPLTGTTGLGLLTFAATYAEIANVPTNDGRKF